MTTQRKDEMPDEIWAYFDDGNGALWHSPRPDQYQSAVKYTRAESPPVPDDVAEAEEAMIRIGRNCPSYGAFECGYQSETDFKTVKAFIRAASTPSAEIRALQKIPLSASTSGDFIAPDYIKGWNAAIEAMTSKVINKVGE